MGLFSGRRQHPEPGTPVCSPDHVYAALLALGPPAQPFAVRPGAGGEPDLVAEARRTKRWQHHTTVITLHVEMRLVPADREVRTLDKQWKASPGPFGLSTWEYGSGNISWKEWGWTLRRGPDGRRRFERDEPVSTEQVKGPLRETVLRCGWSWRSLSYGRP